MRNKYNLGQKVKISVSGEIGTVNGIAFYKKNENEPNYLIRYKNNQGVAVENWWDQDALESVELKPDFDVITIRLSKIDGV